MFGWVLERLRESGLLRGKTVGVDSTTLEANAAMRAIVRSDDGTEYDAWLEKLAKASGIETPTRQDLAKMDMESGAVAGVTAQTMDGGDTASLPVTLDETEHQLAEVGAEPKELVGDKGYHSNATMTGVSERGLRSYVSEPNRGRRKWKGKGDAQKATYGNRRRIRGERGKRLLRERGEKLERTFAHLLVSGGLRRVHVRGQEEIRKRMLVHAAFNLSLVLLSLFGFGTPRGLQGPRSSVRSSRGRLRTQLLGLSWPNLAHPRPPGPKPRLPTPLRPPLAQEHLAHAALVVFATGSPAGHFFHGLGRASARASMQPTLPVGPSGYPPTERPYARCCGGEQPEGCRDRRFPHGFGAEYGPAECRSETGEGVGCKSRIGPPGYG